MKNFTTLSVLLFMILMFTGITPNIAQDKGKYDVDKANETIKTFSEKDDKVASLFKSAYGYAVFPSIGKAGIGVGGAGGKGVVYEKSKAVGGSNMSQVTVGLQLGGQKYSEVIFFENEETFTSFIADKFSFAAQVSAVALASGDSADAKYTDGVMVFTMPLGGLMFEASVGGQKFNFHTFN